MAPTSPGGLRSPDELPQRDSPSGGGAGPAALAGLVPGGAEDDQAQGPQTAQSQAMSSLNRMQAELQGMTRLFPPANKALQSAMTAIEDAKRQIQSQPGQPQTPTPSIGG